MKKLFLNKTIQSLIFFCFISIVSFIFPIVTLATVVIEEKGDIAIGTVISTGDNLMGSENNLPKVKFNYKDTEYETKVNPVLGALIPTLNVGDEVEIGVNEINPQNSTLITGQKTMSYIFMGISTVIFLTCFTLLLSEIKEINKHKNKI